MKTNIGVFFGGRSTEHEISVISASQAMHAINRDKYDVTPIYITKQGRFYTGDALFEIANYRDIPSLLAKCTEVYLKPVYGDYNLYRAQKGGLFVNKVRLRYSRECQRHGQNHDENDSTRVRRTGDQLYMVH